jgi:hypothetical protein
MAKMAAVVSRKLAAAGLERAGKYTAWGYEKDGFVVTNVFMGGATVSFTGHHRTEAAAECARAKEVLVAAGYEVVEGKNNGAGGYYRLEVKEAE